MNKGFFFWGWITGTILAIALSGFIYLQTNILRPPAAVLNTIRLADLNGRQIACSEYKGSVVILNCWATWCGPCLNEFQSLERARKILSREKIVFLAVSDEPLETLAHFRQRHNYGFQYLRSSTPFQDMGISARPSTYVLSKDGSIAFRLYGAIKWDDNEMINKLSRLSHR